MVEVGGTVERRKKGQRSIRYEIAWPSLGVALKSERERATFRSITITE